jgi:enoyl-CoA hydratase/carnithine racemase
MNPKTKLVFINRDIIVQIGEELEELEKNPEVSVVILTGKDTSFAVGADI